MREGNLRKVYFHKIDDKVKKFQRAGYFHKWITYSTSDSCKEYALIEDLEGNIIETFPTNIRFYNERNATFVNIK